MPSYTYTANSELDPRSPDLGLATVFDVSGIEVGTRTTDAAGETSIEIDGSIAGDLFLVVPVIDPGGAIVNGWLKPGGLRTSPFMCCEIPTANAPSTTSGIDVSIGLVDGALPLVDQWIDAGFRFDNATGPKPIVTSDSIATAEFTAVAGGIFSGFDLSLSPNTVAKGGFIRLGRTSLGLDSEGGTGQALQIVPNAQWAAAPSFLVRIRSAGTGGAEAFKFKASYQALFVQRA